MIFYKFYQYRPDLIGSHYIPLEEGFYFLASLAWLPAVMFLMMLGSLLQKKWGWYLLLFINAFSVCVVTNELFFNPADKAINYLKLFFYFGLMAVSSAKGFTGYYRINVKNTFCLSTLAAAMAAFYTVYYLP